MVVMRIKGRLLWFLFLIALMAVSNPLRAKTVFTFIPQWRPQVQFAGFYVAYDKGFYRDAGLNVRFLTGGPDAPSSEYLKDGRADFATMWLSTAIQMRAHGVKLVNIAQLLQRSSLTIVAWRSKIKTVKDLNGKKLGVWGASFMVPFKAFLKKYHINCRIVPQMGSINLFLRGGVDAATAMWYNEYDEIINSGVEPKQLSVFMFYKYGLNFPEDGIYALEKTYKKYPKQCCAFVRATMRGWMYAFEHPKEAVKIVLKYMYKAHVPANRAHQEWMLKAIKSAFCYRGIKGVGILRNSDYEYVANVLKQQGLIDKIPPFKQFYRGCYAQR